MILFQPNASSIIGEQHYVFQQVWRAIAPHNYVSCHACLNWASASCNPLPKEYTKHVVMLNVPKLTYINLFDRSCQRNYKNNCHVHVFKIVLIVFLGVHPSRWLNCNGSIIEASAASFFGPIFGDIVEEQFRKFKCYLATTGSIIEEHMLQFASIIEHCPNQLTNY